MRVLIDTCVLLDAFQEREPFADDAQTIVLLAANNQFNGYLTAKSALDIYYLMHRTNHSDKETRAVLNKVFALFDLLDTQGLDCQQALPSPVADYEDAVMIETAKREGMDCIVTRNAKDFAKSAVQVFSPDEFLKKIEENG